MQEAIRKSASRSCDAKSDRLWTEQRKRVQVTVRVSDSEEPCRLSWLFPCPELCYTLLSSYLFSAEYLSAWPGCLVVFFHRHLNNKLTFLSNTYVATA